MQVQDEVTGTYNPEIVLQSPTGVFEELSSEPEQSAARRIRASGPARVIHAGPSPPIRSGPGQVVTGIFIHSSAEAMDLHLEGGETIGVTPTHPMWSEDRQDFVPAGSLQQGEQLLARDGRRVRITDITPRAGPEPVYNLQVHGEHVYQVGSDGLLVHNNKVGAPLAHGTPYRQLSRTRINQLKAKVANRTITRDEWKHLQWQKRLTQRRQDGIDAFWAQERQLLSQGLPGTRNWDDAARASILAGGQPRAIFSHHKYSVSQYPQLANDPSNILPVTFFEHFQKWHGRNWRNATHGVPLKPELADSF